MGIRQGIVKVLFSVFTVTTVTTRESASLLGN